MEKTHSIQELLIDEDLDVLALTEAWLYDKGDESYIPDLAPKGYTCRSFPRKGRRGGGKALVLRKDIDSLTKVNV